MRLPNFQRLYSNDFTAEQKDLVNKLSVSLNIGIDTLYQALNKQVSLNDNIDCIVKSVDVTVNASGIPTSTTSFKLDDISRNVIGVQVLKADNQTNTSTYPTGGVFITFAQTQNGIQLLHVTGLPASNRFTLKIVAYY